MSWGGFLDGLLNKLPIQGRVERWKNQIDDLEKEKKELQKKECNEKIADRITAIDDKLDKLNQLLKNKAQ